MSVHVAWPAFERQPHIAHAALAQRAIEGIDPLEILRHGWHEKVVVVEDILPHTAHVIQVCHLVGDLLGGPLAEPAPWNHAVQGRNAAVIASADTTSTAHHIGAGHASQQSRRPRTLGPGKRIEIGEDLARWREHDARFIAVHDASDRA